MRTLTSPARIAEYRRDIVAFAEAEYILADTGRPIRLLEHQKRILRAIFTPPYPSEVVWSCPKKSGKTTIGALIALYALLVHTPNGAEVIIAANAQLQAQDRVFRDLRTAVELNVALKATVARSSIELSTGARALAITAAYASAAGSRHSAAIFDELWAFTSEDDRRLYEELTPVPTLPVSMRVIVSYAGFQGEGDLLEGIVTRGMQGERVFDDLPVWRNGGLFLYYDSGPESHRMPWQQGAAGAAYYEQQERELRPNQYRRLHLNEFTSADDIFIRAEQWDACVDPTHHALAPTKLVPITIGIDIGPKHDTSGVVGTYRERDGRVGLAMARKWDPSPGETNIEAVEQYVLERHRLYRLSTVFYDPYQFMSSAERLRKKGVPMREWPQTVDRLTTMGQNLLDLLSQRRIRLYADDALRRHALNAVAKETPRGWRIAKEKSSRKIDLVVALAMAALDSEQQPTRVGSVADIEVVTTPWRPAPWDRGGGRAGMQW